MIVDQFAGKSILIIGDVMLDSYITGSVNRISPEAPVPVLALESTESRLGGAANVALNLVALGAHSRVISVVGNDKKAETLIELLQKDQIGTSGVVQSKNRPTTEKTRLLAKNQQILRVDSEVTYPLNEIEEQDLIQAITSEIQQFTFDAVILQDYNKGVLTPLVIESAISICNGHNIPVFVDPKFQNFQAYQQVFCFKPNLKELSDAFPEFAGKTNSIDEIAHLAEHCRKKLNAQYVFVTLSERGALLTDGKNIKHIPAFTTNKIVDVSGAGDTVISTFTLAATTEANMETAAKIATLSGGLACQQPGVVPIFQHQLKAAIQEYQIITE